MCLYTNLQVYTLCWLCLICAYLPGCYPSPLCGEGAWGSYSPQQAHGNDVRHISHQIVQFREVGSCLTLQPGGKCRLFESRTQTYRKIMSGLRVGLSVVERLDLTMIKELLRARDVIKVQAWVTDLSSNPSSSLHPRGGGYTESRSFNLSKFLFFMHKMVRISTNWLSYCADWAWEVHVICSVNYSW